MKITDFDLAQLCAASYDPSAVWDHSWTADDIHVTHKHVDDVDGFKSGVDIIVFRGSISFLDWWRDLEWLPHKHPRLGWCHAGFLRYMDLVFEEVNAVIGRDVIVTGHSLGGARASILAGLLLDHGSQLVARVTFGSPKPGFRKLATIIQQSGCGSRSYRNGIDPVPEVPIAFSLLPYVDPSPLLLPLEISPAARAELPTSWHAIGNYVKGVSA
jgi:hypothetical protein